jgi:tRNA U34 5-methylaminomethyl-2-thiouridine-forming methyltransferase MnmC
MGLSVLAALEDSRTLRKVLSFDRSLEAVRMALEGTEDLELSGFLKKFRHLLQSLVRDGAVLEEGFEWKVELGEFPSVLKVLPEIPAPHLIFYDFYAPSVSPELWQAEVLQEVSRRVSRGSEPTLLVTYVAQGAFRRQLRSLGWKVERAPGTPSKRETTHAWWGSH